MEMSETNVNFEGRIYKIRRLGDFEFQVETDEGKAYDVVFSEDGTAVCTCPARTPECRHVRMIRERFELPEAKKTAERAAAAEEKETTRKSTLEDFLRKLVGSDILEIFGDSGSGKTAFCTRLVETSASKKIYIDTERNFAEPEPLKSGDYRFLASFNELYNAVAKLRDGYKLVVVDSLGMPALGEYAVVGMKERGEILMKCVAVMYRLKNYAARNDALVVITNQPVSELSGSSGIDRDPFGDKHRYLAKEIWYSQLLSSSPSETRCAFFAWRSRRFGRGKRLFAVKIRDGGVSVEAAF
ncbi:MAG: AAA family ATPase [Methermicoccaceae archaeon]